MFERIDQALNLLGPGSRSERPRARSRSQPGAAGFSPAPPVERRAEEETDFCHASLTRLGAAPRATVTM
jgi:hypothetical protein